MKFIDRIKDRYPDHDFVVASGFDHAIIGVSFSENGTPRIVYSRKTCIQILCARGMEKQEAEEFFDFNVAGAYVGEQTPIWVEDELFTHPLMEVGLN